VASIANEIESIYEYIAPVMSGSREWFQNVPATPNANEYVIRYLLSEQTTETAAHYRLNRDYQIIYFAANEFACITKGDVIAHQLNNTDVIPLKGSDRYMRVGSFSFSQPFKTESGMYAIIGILQLELREARPQATETKIASVNADLYPKGEASMFETLDTRTFDSIESGESIFGEETGEGFTYGDIENGGLIFGKKE
jgi:hypothetical protein